MAIAHHNDLLQIANNLLFKLALNRVLYNNITFVIFALIWKNHKRELQFNLIYNFRHDNC